MRVLVTGAAGFIASSLIDRLLAREDEVVGLDNFDPSYPPAEKRSNLRHALGNHRFVMVEGDLNDPRALQVALEGRVDVVVHLAGKAGVRTSMRDPSGYVRANVQGTQMLLDAMATAGIKALVFASSSSVYGNGAHLPFKEDDPSISPVSAYAATKRAAELLCKVHHDLHGGSLLCLRLFSVYGPRQRPDLAVRKFSTLISEGRPIPMFGDGTAERDYTWIDDTVDGLVRAIDRSRCRAEEFEIINIGTGRRTSLVSLVRMIGEAFGAQPVIEMLPAQAGDALRTCADVAKARQLLGYSARTGIEEGIPRFVDWFRDYRPRATRAPRMVFRLNPSR